MKIPVNAIEIVDGKIKFDLANSEANDDWMRAARLLKEGKLDELEEMDNNKMHIEI